MSDTPEQKEARVALEKAILNYVKSIVKETRGEENPVLLAWNAIAEYSSPSLAPEDLTGTVHAVAEGQLVSTSIGLYTQGVKFYS